MIRHSLRARRLSLCATAAGLFIVGLSVAPVTADAAPVGGRVTPDHGRSNSFLGNIVSGGARWATRSSWENVFRGGVPSFFGAEFVSFSPYSSGVSPVVISQDDAGSQPSFGGSGVTVKSGAVVKLGGGTLQIGSAGSTSNSPVSTVSSGSLTVSQGTPASGTVINVTSGGASDIQSQPGKTADVVAAVPPPPPPAPPLPPKPPGPPVVSR